MLFKKKIERALKFNRERLNNSDKNEVNEFDKKTFVESNKEPMELEKGDFLAMVLAGFWVLAPIFIILILIILAISFL